MSRVGLLVKALTRKTNPVLFAIIMGTGAISTLFNAFPYGTGTRLMTILSLMVFFVNLVLFFSFTAMALVKYTSHRDRWASLLQNPVASLYTGCFPMGATTLINVAVDVIHEEYRFGGPAFLYFIWAFWWLDIVIAFVCCWIGVHVMATRQTHSLSSMTAMWLLPVVTLIVAASSGGVLGRALLNISPYFALITIVVAAFLVTTGLSLALMILTIYLFRLVVYGLPQGGSILSVFLPLGPTGQSGYAILLIGQTLKNLLPYNPASRFLHSKVTGEVIEVVCICAAFLLWSLATMWMLYALLAIQASLRQNRVPFKLSFWGLVFPNGVYANLTIQLATIFGSNAFRVWGSIYAVATFILWASIVLRSLWELKWVVSNILADDSNGTPNGDDSREKGSSAATSTTNFSEL